MKRIERVRLYPTRSQTRVLGFMLDVSRQLYNALLQERRDAYRRNKTRVTSRMQYAELTALRAEDARVAAVYRECQDAVVHRLDLAMEAFFRRCKRGESAGYPRFKPRTQWQQLMFAHGNRALKFDAGQQRVYVPGVGRVKVRKGRVVPAFGRAWIIAKNGRWYGCFECERLAVQGPIDCRRVTGIDRGVHVLAATSNERLFANPRQLERKRLKVERLQRTVARRQCGGKQRRKAVALLARAHERVASGRRDALHKTARTIVDGAKVIAMEGLQVRAMTRSAKGSIEAPGRNVRAKAGLNRALLDASFGLLHAMIVAKAEEAGKTVVVVDARYSSQECARCGHVAAESRRERRYRCVRCDYRNHADVNAALVIRGRAELRPGGRSAVLTDLEDLRKCATRK
jgi:putative transposase